MVWIEHPKVRDCAAAVQTGEVVAYPTEAVWGLGCDPFNELTIAELLMLKRRDPTKGLILVAADMQQLDFLLADLPASQRDTLRTTWPGPMTWLVPHRGRLPSLVTGRHPTVALRVSAHPLVRALCRAVGSPLVSTSANPQGAQPARERFQVLRYFRNDGLAIAPGRVGARRLPSEIRDLHTGQVVRPG